MDALIAAGAVPAAYVPAASLGRNDLTTVTGADLVEGEQLRAIPIAGAPAPASAPGPVAFLDGIQYWSVTGYDGVTPIVRAYVAAAIRRRGADRRLRTVAEAAREIAITCRAALSPAVREALSRTDADVIDLPQAEASQPARLLAAAHVQVDRAREQIERALADPYIGVMGEREWLVVDGILSDLEGPARHPRAIGVVKSHSAQYFEGPDLVTALTLAPGHRTSVFRPRGHEHQPVYSWYLRLWPWEGNDLHYGLLRIEARADAETLERASALSAWLLGERAPLSTPDARWDRLLYPVYEVEAYLKSRAPRDLVPTPGTRLPRNGT
jgi:hypothetical protein